MKEPQAMADTSKQFAQDQLTRFNPNFPQLATVMDNRDPTHSGKLKVWIQGSQSDRDSKESWIEASYLSPFAGRTPGVPGANSYQQYPKGYGFWAVPPDVGCTVAVIFIQGRQFDAYWIGCVYDDRMNTMVPGMATENLPNSGYDMPVPVTDYDRNTIQTNIQEKYPNVPTIEGLKKQNLLYDEEKGAANRSSTRTLNSTVYGMSTPRGNSFVLDDGYTEAELNKQNWNQDPDGYQDTQVNNPVNDTAIGTRKNEGIVLRTRSGAQLLLSEATGSVFIINRDGTARIEMTPDGDIMIHGDKSLNARMGLDINLVAGRNINLQAGADMQCSVAGNTKLNLVGSLDSKIGGQVVINGGADIRIVAGSSLRAQAGSSVDITSGSNTAITAGSNVDISGSVVNLSGGGNSLTVKSGSTASTAVMGAPDFKSPQVGLNDHIHYHAQFSNAENHSDAMKPPQGGGGSSSASQAQPAQPANDVEPVIPEEAEYEAVQYINSTQEVSQVVTQDLLYSSDSMTYTQTFEGLYMFMPCTGTIREFGYWGKSVPTQEGKTADRYGWTIQTKGEVVAPDFGTITTIGTDGVVVAHMTGYKSVFYGLNVSVRNGVRVQKGDVIGTGKGVIQFEIRRVSANLYGFSGTVDPGKFYATVTGEGADAANKGLTGGQPSNPNAPQMDATTYSENSDELVVMTKVKSIGSGYSQRGSRHVPRRKTAKRQVSVNDDTPAISLGPVDKTAVGWKVLATDEKLVNDTINFEGTIAYQTKVGHFRNGKFWVFPDPVKGQDIGYGHLVTASERASGVFNNGITPEQAKQILIKDLQRSVDGAKRLYAQYSLQTPYLCQIVLVEMAYQMGAGALGKFKGMFKALQQGNYKLAAHHIRDSLWYRQTTRRAETMALYMEACQ